jgi:hypothetical protein
MKRAGIARKKTKDTSKAVSPKRVKQIQKVFDQLGIGDEASRRSVRPMYAPASEQTLHYRIVLSGSTQL